MAEIISKTVFIDCSGSTGGHEVYWNTVMKIIESQGPQAKFVAWDSEAIVKSYEDARALAQLKSGGGGTYPECFAPLAVEDSDIIIITDGQVFGNSVTACDNILKSRPFHSVVVYFISTGGPINLSVSAPFTRRTDYLIYKDGEQFATGSTRSHLSLDEYFGNPEKFIEDSDALYQKIFFANAGINNVGLRLSLLDLQKNLLRSIADMNDAGDLFKSLHTALQRETLAVCFETTQKIISESDNSMGKKIEAIIQQMINQCSGTPDFGFDSLKPGRIQRQTAIDIVEVDEVILEESYNGKFECPISLEAAMPTLFLAEGDPVLSSLDKGYLDAILTNPFLVLDNATLVEAIKARLDHIYGLDAAQMMFAGAADEFHYGDASVRSPTTRRPVVAAFALGKDESHRKATDYTLARLFFGHKLVGQPELWLGIVYLVLKKVPYLASDEGFVSAFKDHMLHRMRTRNTAITLSGLPVAPMVRCPVDVAIWYCVSSPLIINNATPVDDDRNRLRSFGSGAKYLAELLEAIGFPYDRDWTLKQLSFYKAFAWMMKAEKDNAPWRDLLRAQYQNSLTLSDGTIVLLDGPASLAEAVPLLPDFSVSIRDASSSYTPTVGELIALARLVDRSKTIGVINIPTTFTGAVKGDKDFTAVANYGYPLGDAAIGSDPVPICPATMRPYTMDRRERRHWLQRSEELYGPLKLQLSTHNYFIEFTVAHSKYPENADEFIKYMAVKQANREDGNAKNTLPAAVKAFVSYIVRDYEEVCGADFSLVPAAEFVRITKASVDTERRLALDDV